MLKEQKIKQKLNFASQCETGAAAAVAAAHLDDATRVLSDREVHVGTRTRSPYWSHIQQVPPGAIDQLLVLNAHPSQHHPLRAVVVLQVAVEHRLVYVVHVICWAKAWQSNCVAPVRSLGTVNTSNVQGKIYANSRKLINEGQ